MTDIRELLEKVKSGEVPVEKAEDILKRKPFEDIDYARIDTHRQLRQGAAEVIYGEGKTSRQIAGIVLTMKKAGQDRILVTRVSPAKAAETEKILEEKIAFASETASAEGEGMSENTCSAEYYSEAGLLVIGGMPEADGKGTVLVVTGGTSDIFVAEEAALTAEFHGSRVERLYDVGVSGLHRLLANMEVITEANVIIAVAGMEGALASVIGGLTDKPVIAVPTSVGYGASFEGMTALLSMLNSCSSGVSVVNIDNGFGAGYLAGMINHMGR